jgi:hypothetical protein
MSRGLIANTAGTNLFVVVEDVLYSVAPDGTRTSRGVLNTRRGHVGMKIGLTQLVITDGVNGYVFDLQSQTFNQIIADGWLGSATVEYLDGYFVFIQPNSQTFYISELENALSLDALDFATANASPDKLVGQVTTGRVLVLFGAVSGEIWQDSGTADFPLERNQGAFLEVGLMAPHSVCELDNTIYWLGRDPRGAGTVYMMRGFNPVRISTDAVDEKIQDAIEAGEDVSKAIAFAYQDRGHSFYHLQVPGLETTWVYDAATGTWHERAELVLGDYEPHRAKYHAYCYGRHLVVGDDDIIDAYDHTAYTNRGDVLVRDRISPHYATPQLSRINYGLFELDGTVGFGKAGQSEAKALLRYSNDGGYAWSGFKRGTLGAVGQKTARTRWTRNGSAYDRVWHVRCTDNAPFSIINAAIEAK